MSKPHYLDDPAEERQTKKPRFDARNPSTLAAEEEDNDHVLELDEIGKGGLQAKRGAVDVDAYDSDSSNDNFQARADAKAKTGKKSGNKEKTADEDENDMFADLEEEMVEDGDEDEDITREGKKRSKAVRFMEDKDIEGQVAGSKSGGHVSANFSMDKQQHEDSGGESSEDDSEADEARDRIDDDMDKELGAGAKKKHAPRLDAFNMKSEAEEGRFDSSGNFIRRQADPYAKHDSWLDGVSKADIRKAKAASEKREKERREREIAVDAIPISDSLAALISNMKPGETVMESLARRAPKQKHVPKSNWKKKKEAKAGQMDVDATIEPKSAEEMARIKAVEDITDAANHLMDHGQGDIYEQERAMLQRRYHRETGEDWVDPNKTEDGDKQWEFRWTSDGVGEIHGPFDGGEMAAWKNDGYFEADVEFREIGGEEWSQSVDFV